LGAAAGGELERLQLVLAGKTEAHEGPAAAAGQIQKGQGHRLGPQKPLPAQGRGRIHAAGRVHAADNGARGAVVLAFVADLDRKSTRLNSSHVKISYAVCCLKIKSKCQAPDRVIV